jgi:hypothetical protein
MSEVGSHKHRIYMLAVALALLVLLMLPFVGAAQVPASALLAFSLIQYEAGHDYPETVYLYDVEANSLQRIGSGDALRWSRSGRYLAMTDTLNDVLSAEKYLGRMRNFTVYDLQTGDAHTWEYAYGEYLDWSPEEAYLLAAGSISGSGGANAWVNFLNADGSGEAPEAGAGYADGMSGMRGGISALGWVGSGENAQLIARDIGFRRDDYLLVNPATGERIIVAGELPPYRPIERGWGETGVAQSSDHRYAAVTRVASIFSLSETFSTFLLIVDMTTGDSHEVSLPNGAVVGQMAWRPCDSFSGECG